ncbi:hypothetical protein [Candidatus Chromulinivorax destructor]|uniref:Uncharacterized protein n=1 Tax=Candidatus Chromulinivorax destructor TaxID=2066483 RepID=A0A345ZBF6_9BACT|nr:hypothetical protein [Candidatus Chromulinivorax destructor]AXK60623.1 hypothetical protein C0J27_02600 [Candidatus Chromulinivorax destructor]
MKNLKFLALSLLLSTSACMMNASVVEETTTTTTTSDMVTVEPVAAPAVVTETTEKKCDGSHCSHKTTTKKCQGSSCSRRSMLTEEDEGTTRRTRRNSGMTSEQRAERRSTWQNMTPQDRVERSSWKSTRQVKPNGNVVTTETSVVS